MAITAMPAGRRWGCKNSVLGEVQCSRRHTRRLSTTLLVARPGGEALTRPSRSWAQHYCFVIRLRAAREATAATPSAHAFIAKRDADEIGGVSRIELAHDMPAVDVDRPRTDTKL